MSQNGQIFRFFMFEFLARPIEYSSEPEMYNTGGPLETVAQPRTKPRMEHTPFPSPHGSNLHRLPKIKAFISPHTDRWCLLTIAAYTANLAAALIAKNGLVYGNTGVEDAISRQALSLSLTHTHTHTLPHTLSHCLTLPHTLSRQAPVHPLTLSLTPSHTPSHTAFHTLPHTLSHGLTLPHTLSRQAPVCVFPWAEEGMREQFPTRVTVYEP